MLRYTPPRAAQACGHHRRRVAALVVVDRPHHARHRRAAASPTGPTTNALPVVSVINLGQARRRAISTLPGNVQAFNSAPIYARVSGYLKKWYVDIGTPR